MKRNPKAHDLKSVLRYEKDGPSPTFLFFLTISQKKKKNEKRKDKTRTKKGKKVFFWVMSF